MKILSWVLTILGWWLVATGAFYAILLPAAVADWLDGLGSVQGLLLYVLLYIVIWLALGLALIRWSKRLRRRAPVPERPDPN